MKKQKQSKTDDWEQILFLTKQKIRINENKITSYSSSNCHYLL
jgi:hypothetical protein